MSQHLIQTSRSPAQIQSQSALKQKACVHCRARKVKCDKKIPCTNCTLWSLECVYPSPVRTCRRVRKKLIPPGSDDQGNEENSQSLDERVHKLEKTLDKLSELIGGADCAPAQSLISQDQLGDVIKPGRLDMIEQRIGEMVKMRSKEGFYGSEPNYRVNPSATAAFGNGFASFATKPARRFPFNNVSAESAPLHPSTNQARTCWQAFLQNVDPLVKVLHRQSTERILQKEAFGVHDLTKGEEALLFAMYFSSISTMAINDVETCFKTSKGTLLAMYRSATEQALMEAEFLTTNDLTTVQAFVLFLSSSRFMNEAKLVWTLTGLARRLSFISMDGLSPFDEELSRRLWWQLWYLDQRAAEDHGRDSSSLAFTSLPMLPLNVNDADIGFNMIHPAVPRQSWTEMSFCLIRFEIAKISGSVDANIPLHEKERIIHECEYRMKSTYLIHCDETKHTHWLAHHVTHVLIMEMWFKLYGQLRHSPNEPLQIQATRDRLFSEAMDIVDIVKAIENEPRAQNWKWLLASYLQFLPLAFLLTELCHRKCSEAVNRAWSIVESAFTRWADDINVSKNGTVLVNLMEKAKTHRAQLVEWHPLEKSLITPESSRSPTDVGADENIYQDANSQSSNLESFLIPDMDYPPINQPAFIEDASILHSIDLTMGSSTNSYDPFHWCGMDILEDINDNPGNTSLSQIDHFQ